MIIIFALFNPFSLILIINFVVFTTYEIYSLPFLVLISPAIILAVGYMIYLKKFLTLYSRDSIKRSMKLDTILWRLYGYLICLIGLSELLYFGVPLLGQVRYIDFGFTILHHIAVTTWLLVFINFKYKLVNLASVIFAVIFPLLIFNRDVFLLTLCCLLFKGLIHQKLNIRHLIYASVLFIGLFGYVGKMRSGNMQALLDLPTKFDLASLDIMSFWLFTYVTSPMFNIHYSFDSGERIRYEPLLTVFPEFYKLIELFSYLGFYIYLLVGVLLTLLPALLRFPGWLCFSFFFYYQFTMGCVFSNKLGNTHTIYVILIFITMMVFRQMFSRRINKEASCG